MKRACGNAGAEVVRCVLDLESDFELRHDAFIEAMSACNMAFLCNPNNPTGRLVPKAGVLAIADAARKLGCLLVVDEAFIDFCPEESIVGEAARNPFLAVLRSMTKFYALAGLRIGYGVFHAETAVRVMEHKEPWTVNALAQAGGRGGTRRQAFRRGLDCRYEGREILP